MCRDLLLQRDEEHCTEMQMMPFYFTGFFTKGLPKKGIETFTYVAVPCTNAHTLDTTPPATD